MARLQCACVKGSGIAMPKGELVRKLIASYGRSDEFRAVALQIIEDAEKSNQRPLASSLRKSLDANAAAAPSSNVRRLAPLADATDPAQQFLDAIEPERGAKDIVLDDVTRGLVNGILTEHRRGEESCSAVLRAAARRFAPR